MDKLFDVFDEGIGVDGYYQIIRNKLFPNSTPQSFDVGAFCLQERIFRKGSTFSRVRYLHDDRLRDFLQGHVTKDDFFPPKLHKVDIPQGRFNSARKRTCYLADHPFVAMMECDIKPGDYFLLSHIKFAIDMRFVFVEPGKDEFSSLLYQLLKAKDTRFYSVTNKVNDEILSFQGFQGIAYNSTKVDEGHLDRTWGAIHTTMNLAIAGANIKDSELAAGWLAYCDEDGRIFQHSLFKPLSKKKKHKLLRINFHNNKSAFILESQKTMRELNEESKKTARLLKERNYSDFNQSPIKILWK
jgi:hypothetical protein